MAAVKTNQRIVGINRHIGDARFGIRGSLRRLERDVEAVLRHQSIPAHELTYPQALTVRRFSLQSQNEEDGMTLALVGESEPQHRRFVELGCGSNGGNSGVLARELGWKGLMVDADAEKLRVARRSYSNAKVKCVHSWITRDNVNELIVAAGLDGELGVLSIDIDGNDYWVWEAITVCQPLLVVIEYNSLFGPKQAVVVPYDGSFDRHEHPKAPDGKAIYFGASLEALVRLGRAKGYRLVAVEPRGVNAFFLREGYRPEIPASSPKDCHRVLDKYITHNLSKLIDAHELPLVPIPAPDADV